MSINTTGICRLCGETKKLTREHFPPKGAFNNSQFKSTSVNQYKTKKGIVWHDKWYYGGNAKYRTCIDCNNNTGSWYAKDYIDFAQACEPFARPRNAGVIGYIDTIPFYPLRVVKQAICSILAASQTEHDFGNLSTATSPRRAYMGPPPDWILTDLSAAARVLPSLRKFVLNKEATGLPDGVRLYLYLVAGLKGRSSGFNVMANEREKTFAVNSELAWFPLGWVLLCDGVLNEPIRDVTKWARFDYNFQWKLPELAVSCQWTEGGIIDFRSPEEIEKGRIKSHEFLKSIGRI